jgi:hypothetical protein
MEPFDVKSISEVDAWVARNGVKALDSLNEPGRLDVRQRMLLAAWAERRDGALKAAREAEQRDLMRRSTEAAEKSADAASEAARHAGASARWAKWAAIFAAVALVGSGWPYLRTVVRLALE